MNREPAEIARSRRLIAKLRQAIRDHPRIERIWMQRELFMLLNGWPVDYTPNVPEMMLSTLEMEFWFGVKIIPKWGLGCEFILWKPYGGS